MTILPGHPLAAPEGSTPPAAPAPPSEPSEPRAPRGPRGPQLSVSGRTLAAVLAGVVAAGGGWYFLHSAGAAAPAAAVVNHPVVHHASKAALPAGKVAAPRTAADALKVATRVFAVLPAQLPGWNVDGKTKLETDHDTSPVSLAVQRCLAAAHSGGIGVDSPELSQTTSTPTYTSVDANLGFVRSARRAAADFAVVKSPAVQHCIASATVGRDVPIAPGATMRFTSMKALRAPRGVVAWQYDGQIDSNVIGGQPVRVVMLMTVDRSTEVLLTSSGLGVALPLATDLRVLGAITAQTRRLIA